MDRSELSVDRFELSMDRFELSMDRFELSMDRFELSMDRSELSMDRSELSMDRSELSMDRSARRIDGLELFLMRRSCNGTHRSLSVPDFAPGSIAVSSAWQAPRSWIGFVPTPTAARSKHPTFGAETATPSQPSPALAHSPRALTRVLRDAHPPGQLRCSHRLSMPVQ